MIDAAPRRIIAILPLILAAAAASPAAAHETITTKLTWSREISRIVYKRCASCHRDGGPAPMSLVHYTEARPWAKAIQEEVAERRMPPWGAAKGFGDLHPDFGLSQEEINRLCEWVEGGAPEGDPKYLPEKTFIQTPSTQPPVPRRKPVVLRAGPSAAEYSLPRPAALSAISPLSDADSTQITAIFPNGAVEPVLWLRQYRAKWRRTFHLRSPLSLPAGARLRIDPPTPLQLWFE